MNYKKEIIAVLDPMCSWCWGFEPVLQKLQETLPADTKLSLVLGGLRSKGDQVWNKEFRSYLKEHWTNVQARTGQVFNMDLLDKEVFEYDTEPACRAVVVVRELDERRQFSFFRELQKAFYTQSKDISLTDVLVDIVEENGLDKREFLNLFESEKMKEKTRNDSYKARSMGANAFPSLVFIDEEGHLCVVKGYKSFEEIKKFMN